MDWTSRRGGGWLVAFGAIGFASSACVKTSLTFQVRDAGAVGVSTTTVQGPSALLPPDGAERSVVVPIEGRRVVTLLRQQGRIMAVSPDGSAPVELVDGWGMLAPIARGRGVETRGSFLDARYSLTSTQVLREADHPIGAIPITLTTDLSNVADVRLVHEPRRWPAYVLLPLGGLFALAGAISVTDGHRSNELDGMIYLAASVPLLAFGLVSALTSTTYESVDLNRGLSAVR